jgi:beta-ribofuranosylaminobenzene 5'-phosphate synthase
MIRIRTPSRLHFGLIAPAAKTGRRFGGAGLMIDQPGIEVTLEPAKAWRVCGSLAERGQAILDRLMKTYLGTEVDPHTIRIHTDAPEHMGLGTGTQLALAIARGLAEAGDLEDKSAIALAPLVGRGLRSAIGTHGFDLGGFLVDGGRMGEEDIAPLVAWLEFPEAWRIVLILPRGQAGVHGVEERHVFEHLQEVPGQTEGLCRRVLLEMLPALEVEDFDSFAESLYQFNRAAGEPFAKVQGGPYASARTAALIQYIRNLEVVGVGQTSWGPGVFVLTQDEEQARWVVKQVQEKFQVQKNHVLSVAADNHGAQIS